MEENEVRLKEILQMQSLANAKRTDRRKMKDRLGRDLLYQLAGRMLQLKQMTSSESEKTMAMLIASDFKKEHDRQPESMEEIMSFYGFEKDASINANTVTLSSVNRSYSVAKGLNSEQQELVMKKMLCRFVFLNPLSYVKAIEGNAAEFRFPVSVDGTKLEDENTAKMCSMLDKWTINQEKKLVNEYLTEFKSLHRRKAQNIYELYNFFGIKKDYNTYSNGMKIDGFNRTYTLEERLAPAEEEKMMKMMFAQFMLHDKESKTVKQTPLNYQPSLRSFTNEDLKALKLVSVIDDVMIDNTKTNQQVLGR